MTPDHRLRRRLVDVVNDYCDRLKPHEIGGNNKGPWVSKFLAWVGVTEPSPWCMAFVCYSLKQVPWNGPKWKAVIECVRFAKKNDLVTHNFPAVGDIALRINPGGWQGHCGIVTAIHLNGWIETVEGNTSAGATGSQRDGDGVYRRVRHESYWNEGFCQWYRLKDKN